MRISRLIIVLFYLFIFSDQCSGRLFCTSYPCISQWRLPNWLRPSSVSVAHKQGKNVDVSCVQINVQDFIYMFSGLYVCISGRWVIPCNVVSIKGSILWRTPCVFVHVCPSYAAWVSWPASIGCLECSLASAGWQIDTQRGRGLMSFPSRQKYPSPFFFHSPHADPPFHLDFSDQQKTLPLTALHVSGFSSQSHSLHFSVKRPRVCVWEGMLKSVFNTR